MTISVVVLAIILVYGCDLEREWVMEVVET